MIATKCAPLSGLRSPRSSSVAKVISSSCILPTSASLMCKNGVNLKLTRQDDVGKMQEELITFATELERGERNPDKGAHFVAIMGDGAATFLKGINDQLRRLGPEYQAKVVGSAGYSRGEDKFMGLPEWKQNPATSRGGLVAGYLRDGDWNKIGRASCR